LFEGDTPLSIAIKKKTEPVPDPKKLNPQISEDLDRLILKCLERDREERYQNVENVISDLENIEQGIPSTERAVLKRKSLTSREITVKFSLRKIFVPALVFLVVVMATVMIWRLLPHRAAVSSQLGKHSIAVLPFEDLSPEKGHEYLCEGIPETLINALNNIADLRVPARTSSFSFKGKEHTVGEIGQKLNVETVLEGSIQVVGNNLQVTARLINVKDGYLLWNGRYPRQLADLFSIQDDIAQEIVKALKIKLLGEKEAEIVKRYTENIEAYNLYLKGRYFWNMRTGEGLNKAIENFGQAIQKDPKYAIAYSGLADSYSLLPWYGRWLPKEAYPKARAAALQALELDSSLAEAHTSLAAVYHWYDWDWLAAEKEFKRAIELNPRYPTVHQWYGRLLVDTGRSDEGINEGKRALELDPLSLIINTNLGDYLYNARRYDEAKEQYLKALEIDPAFNSALIWLGKTYLKKGMFREAIEEVRNTQHPVLAYAYMAWGNKAEAFQFYEDLKKRATQQRIDPTYLAMACVGIGKIDLAFEDLEKAYQERHPRLIDFLQDPLNDSIRQDPRFKALLKKMNLPEFWAKPSNK
jgi:TolB-like protein/Tfp pilus assembly protein PilF